MQFTEWLHRAPGSPRREFTVFALALGGGVMLGLLLPPSAVPWLLAAALCVVLALFINPSSSRKKVIVIAIALCLVGLARGAEANTVLALHLPETLQNKSVLFAGTVENYPRRAPGGTTFTLDVLEAAHAPATTRLRVTAVTSAKLIGTETVRVTCAVKPDAENPSFDERLERQGIQGSCFTRSIEVLSDGQGVAHGFARLRDVLRTRVDAVVKPPESAFLRGLLYGDDADFPKALRDDFRTAGVSHIVAVSGSNVSLMTVSLFLLVTTWWLSRKRAAAFVTAVLIGFVLLVGFEASIVRAALMGSLLLLAKFLGRPTSKPNIFLAAVVGMLCISPNIVFTLAFQLTVLATFAIMFFVPALEAKNISLVASEELNALLLSTGAVFLVTAPIISSELGTVSLVSLFSNLVILTLVPFATVLSLATLFAALVWIPLGAVIAAPTELLLSLILYLVRLFASVPHASVAFALPTVAAALIEAGILLWVVRMSLENAERELHGS